jgi:hypothetical protein
VTVKGIKHPFANRKPFNLALNLNSIGFNRHFNLRIRNSKIIVGYRKLVETLRDILVAVLKNELLKIRHLLSRKIINYSHQRLVSWYHC